MIARSKARVRPCRWFPESADKYLRQAFFARTLSGCHSTVTISFGTLFSQCGARLDERAYVGPGCSLGLVHLERDVLLGAGVHVTSGRHTHGTEPGRALRFAVRRSPEPRCASALARGSAAALSSWPTWDRTASSAPDRWSPRRSRTMSSPSACPRGSSDTARILKHQRCSAAASSLSSTGTVR